MRYLTLILTMACAQCSPVPVSAIELVDGKVALTAKELDSMKSCPALGGCYIVTLAALEAMVEKTAEVTLIEAAKSCRRWDLI